MGAETGVVLTSIVVGGVMRDGLVRRNHAAPAVAIDPRHNSHRGGNPDGCHQDCAPFYGRCGGDCGQQARTVWVLLKGGPQQDTLNEIGEHGDNYRATDEVRKARPNRELTRARKNTAHPPSARP